MLNSPIKADGTLKIVSQTPGNEAAQKGLHPRIDDIERRFIDLGHSPKKIAKSLQLKEREVVKALLQVGLEVYGECRKDLTHSSKARFEALELS
jgi:hypothetical protein